MATIVTRLGKGSALTYQEADDNWTGLNTEVGGKQAADATLTALAGLDATAGLVEQTASDTFTKRAIGVAASTSILTRADGDTRFATAAQGTLAASASQPGHTHAQADVTGLVSDLALKAPLDSPTFTGVVTLPAGQVVNGVTLTTGGGTTNFLRADGTYAAAGGSGPSPILAWAI